jgi:hypothetical protein
VEDFGGLVAKISSAKKVFFCCVNVWPQVNFQVTVEVPTGVGLKLKAEGEARANGFTGLVDMSSVR